MIPYFLNNLTLELASSITDTDTTIDVTAVDHTLMSQLLSTSSLTPGYLDGVSERPVVVPMVLVPADEEGAGIADYEGIFVVGGSGTSLTVLRQVDQQLGPAAAWPAGTKLECRESANILRWVHYDDAMGTASDAVNISPINGAGGAPTGAATTNVIKIGTGINAVAGASAGTPVINIGSGNTNGTGSVSIGSGGTTTADAISIGAGQADGAESISISSSANGAHGDGAIGIGTKAAVEAGVIALGNSGSNSAPDSVAIGTNASANGSASDSGAVSIGLNASTTVSFAVAIGSGASANATSSVALGDGADASGSTNQISIGTGAETVATSGIAIGNSAAAYGISALSIGDGSTVNTKDSVSIGPGALVSAPDGVALGLDASVQHASCVALGASAATTADNQIHGGDRDLELGKDTSQRGVHLYSPDGTRYRITVDNTGTVIATADPLA